VAAIAMGPLSMSSDALDELFAESPPGPIPSGIGRGTAIVAPGSAPAKVLAELTKAFFWQGKVFDADQHQLLNVISPFSLRAIRAAVYEGESWIDGRPSIVLDYSRSVLPARPIRDEIRMIGDGEYLGIVILGKQKIPLRFHLAFSIPRPKED
jgi:hypothetical protein